MTACCSKCGTPIPEPWPEEYVCLCGGATIRPGGIPMTHDPGLIRAAALEEAAKLVEHCSWTENGIATAIRALKEQP